MVFDGGEVEVVDLLFDFAGDDGQDLVAPDELPLDHRRQVLPEELLRDVLLRVPRENRGSLPALLRLRLLLLSSRRWRHL